MEHLKPELLMSLASRLENEPKVAVLHFLGCGRCRGKLASLLEEDTDPELGLLESVVDFLRKAEHDPKARYLPRFS